MGRVIDITFNDKSYALEFDRYAVLKFMELQNSGDSDGVTSAINLVHCGLIKHHSNEMPENDEILGWLLVLGDELEPFTKELSKCVEEVTTALQNTKSGNLKWGVRK